MKHSSALRILFTTGVLALFAAPAAAQDTDGDSAANAVDVFPCDPTAAGVAFAPGEGAYGTIIIEDQYPRQGDLDFNDIVLAYNYLLRTNAAGNVVSMRLTFAPIALGGTFDNGLAIHLPVARANVTSMRLTRSGAPIDLTLLPDAEATAVVFENLRVLFGDQDGQINSQATTARRSGESFVIDVVLNTPIAVNMGLAPFDVFAFRTENPALEIHRPEYSGSSRFDNRVFGTQDDGSAPGRWFVDADGLPFGLNFPQLVDYPSEATEISALYPDIVTFAGSGGVSARDFYRTNVQTESRYSDATGQTRLVPAAPAALSPDTSCLTPSVSLPAVFATAPQFYCNGGCSWAGVSGCDQADADIFCRLRTGSRYAYATSFSTGTALAQPGFSCRAGTNYGRYPAINVNVDVWYQGPSILATHGAGTVIRSVNCNAGSNTAPTARISGPGLASVNVAASFSGSGSTDSDGTIASYGWNFGDGTTGTGATVSKVFNAEGNYTVSLTVTDDAGARSTTTMTVIVGVAPAPPAEFQSAPQFYCNGGCSWAGASGCDQADANFFCRLRTGNPNAIASSFTLGTALAQPGFSCRAGTNYGAMPQFGVPVDVWYQSTSILANHGAGQVITGVTCN